MLNPNNAEKYVTYTYIIIHDFRTHTTRSRASSNRILGTLNPNGYVVSSATDILQAV